MLELDLADVRPSVAGPKRPQDRVPLSEVDDQFNGELEQTYNKHNEPRVPVEGEDYDLGNGDVVIAAITSCTNTSNPSVLVAAGLVPRKARAFGLDSKPWVKTSLAPGSKVVSDYLDASGLSEDLNALGFDLVGYGCTTCIGNSGPLPAPWQGEDAAGVGEVGVDLVGLVEHEPVVTIDVSVGCGSNVGVRTR